MPAHQPASPASQQPTHRRCRHAFQLVAVASLEALMLTHPPPLPLPARSSQVVVVDHSAHGVDLPEDVASLEAIMRQQGFAPDPAGPAAEPAGPASAGPEPVGPAAEPAGPEEAASTSP